MQRAMKESESFEKVCKMQRISNRTIGKNNRWKARQFASAQIGTNETQKRKNEQSDRKISDSNRGFIDPQKSLIALQQMSLSIK